MKGHTQSMKTVQQIVAPLPQELQERIIEAIKLMRIQSHGAESYRQNAEVWTKDDDTPVSVADLLHQTQLQQMLADKFSEDGLISEEPRSLQEESFETASKVSRECYELELAATLAHCPEQGEVTWVFDPIDGTKGYLKGRYYAIALGFFKGNEPIFGGMAVPHSSELNLKIDGTLAFALKGHGAWIAKLDTKGELQFEALRCDQNDLFNPSKIGMSLEHGGAIATKFDTLGIERVKIDSQAKYLAVASGELDAYLRQSRTDRPTDLMWDHLPGVLIAQEAGAHVMSFDDSEITLNPEANILFQGGMKCFRGEQKSEFSQVLDELVKA